MASSEFTWSCSVPNATKVIQMGHGGGGRLTHQLIDRIFQPVFSNPLLNAQHDGAILPFGNIELAFSTDSYVVQPLFFPGGDIGSLSIHGTVNDLAMCGAKPLYLSASFILEEGFALDQLQKITESMQRTALATGINIVTGDTKVVDRGHGDGLYITTSGIGQIVSKFPISPMSIQPGDAILLSGDIGRHGVTILAARGQLSFETDLISDCADLSRPVLALLQAGIEVHCLRDLTRGGLATAAIELSQKSHLHFLLDEKSIEVGEDVQSCCELLGLNPLYIANEGRFICFVKAEECEKAISILQSHPVSARTHRIGTVREHHPNGLVTAKGIFNSEKVLDMLSGEQLPRIC